MRVVVFTGNPAIERTPWWPVVLATPGIRRVLVCRKVQPMDTASVIRRFRRNVRKHGLIFVPYRLLMLAASALKGRPGSASAGDGNHEVPAIPCDHFETPDLDAENAISAVRSWSPDLGISLGAPILRPSVFRIPVRGTINLHLGKVPDFRGAPPAFWELFTGAGEIGATVHWIDESLDTGRVIEVARAPIYPHDTLGTAVARAEELGCIVLRQSLCRLAVGNVEGTPQPSGGRTYRFPTLRQRGSLAVRLARQSIVARFGSARYLAKRAAGIALFGFRPLRDLVRTLTGSHPVRVFTYHRITNLCRDGMTISPAEFRRQIRYIARHHRIVGLADALELLRNGMPLRRPVAVITFDDGYQTVFDVARPILAEFDVPASCFVSTDLIGTDRRFPHDDGNAVRPLLSVMGWDELERLQGLGWTIGAHGATHARLSACSGGELERELSRPLDALRTRLHLNEVPMAYPFGGAQDISAEGVARARTLGYTACFSDFGGENRPGGEQFERRRIDIGGDHRPCGWKLYAHGFDLGRWRAILRLP